MVPHEFDEFAYVFGNTDTAGDQMPAYVYDPEGVDPFAFVDATNRYIEQVTAVVEPYWYDEYEELVGPVAVIPRYVAPPVTLFPVTVVPEAAMNVSMVQVSTVQEIDAGAGIVNIFYGSRWVMGFKCLASGRMSMERAMTRHGQKARATRLRFRTLEGPGKGRRVVIRGPDGAPAVKQAGASEGDGRITGKLNILGDMWGRFTGWL